MTTTSKSNTLIKGTTERSVDEVCQSIESVCKENGFGVLGSLDLKEKMNSKGVDFARECRIYEVCNPKSAAAVLNENMDISTSLPCRIAVYADSRSGETVVSTVKPSRLIDLYDAPGAEEEAREIEGTMGRILAALTA